MCGVRMKIGAKFQRKQHEHSDTSEDDGKEKKKRKKRNKKGMQQRPIRVTYVQPTLALPLQ